MKFPFLRNVALKGILLFIVFVLIIGAIPADTLGRISIYNHLVPGRPRLPFGETPQRSYNLSLYNLEAMFASHEISAARDASKEYRVILLGDSSIWGTLLKPEETLSGQLNSRQIQLCGKPARFYNLGYPTISLAKDVLILNRALQTNPDLVIWSTSLEAFPTEKQFASPLAESNKLTLESLLGEGDQTAASSNTLLENSLFGRRRELADWARLQFYGIPWAASGIDQDYPEHYTLAATDLDADNSFHGLKPGDNLQSSLAWDVLEKGMDLAKRSSVPVLLVNEPILISTGENSSIRYNFYYPRWAYDAYRSELKRRADASMWTYLDAWDSVAADQFTNSAIHLTPAGEGKLADNLMEILQKKPCP